MSIELKIKAKHLALEPAIIRKEEEKLKKQIKWLQDHQMPYHKEFWKLTSLISHRKSGVRNEARATHLARAFLKGKPYSSVERSCKDPAHRDATTTMKIVAMYNKYRNFKEQPSITTTEVLEWFKT